MRYSLNLVTGSLTASRPISLRAGRASSTVSEMKTFWFFAAAAGVGLLVVVLRFGTVEPCGILRAQIRHEAIREGGFTATVALLPDSVIDGLIAAAQDAPLSPGRCLALAFTGMPTPPPAAQPRASALVTPPAAQVDEWNLCGKTSLSQVAAALLRDDVATLSRPEMIHGSCTSQGTLKNGRPIGVRVIFAPDGAIGTSVYIPASNADPMTNRTLRQYPVK